MWSPTLSGEVMTMEIEDTARAARRREQVGEIATALVCLALWASVWYVVSGFPETAQRFPRFVLLCLFGFSVIHLVKASWLLVQPPRRERVGHEPTDSAAQLAVRRPEWRPLPLLALIAGSIVYLLLISRIGFVVATVAFLVVGVCVSIGWTVKRVAAIVALVVGLYVLVQVLLDVRLPDGVLF